MAQVEVSQDKRIHAPRPKLLARFYELSMFNLTTTSSRCTFGMLAASSHAAWNASSALALASNLISCMSKNLSRYI